MTRESPVSRAGKVFLVGAGPGDPGLLTLKGLEILAAADTIIHDRLVAEEILLSIAPEVRLIDGGKISGGPSASQDEINRALIEEARAGRRVVRLKGGDPFLFGRGGEEALALSRAGIDWEAVPGISSALAVPAWAGIPLTHRGISSALHIITWRDAEGKTPRPEFLENLARAGGSLVILMGGSALPEIGKALIKAGFSWDLPAAVVENGMQPSRGRILRLTLGDFAGTAPAAGPAIIVAGPVCALGEELLPAKTPRVPENLSLEGLRIIVTRPEPKNAELCARIRDFGGEAIPFPCVKTIPEDHPQLDRDRGAGEDESGAEFGEIFSWLIFTSVQGVNYFFEAYLRGELQDLFGGKTRAGDIRALAGCRFAAIGPATAEALKRRGFVPDLVPPVYRSQELAQGLPHPGNSGPVLLVRPREASPDLPEILRERGIPFRELPVYRLVPAEGNSRARKLIQEGAFDIVFFSSPSIVTAFAAAFPGLELSSLKAICIGESTVRRARELGINPRTAKEASEDSMISLARAYREGGAEGG